MNRFALVVLLLACYLAAPAESPDASPAGSVTVVGEWSGQEEQDFDRVLARFTRTTGVTVYYRGSQSVGQVLDTDVADGQTPDVAMLSSPGQLETYASEGVLRPLDHALAGGQQEYGRQWRELDRGLQPQGRPSGHQYVVAVKADLKSVIWYDPAALRDVWSGPLPATWDQLLALDDAITAHGGTPWCIGMEATPNSGWPGTDWIEDILLHQSGVRTYEQLADGSLSWQDPRVRQAWLTWGRIVDGGSRLFGGTPGALLTDYQDTGKPMFTAKPGCYLDHKAAFVIGDYESDGGRGRFDFFPFPSVNGTGADVHEVSADFAAMFHDTPQAEALIRFLASPQGQRIWPSIPDGGAYSPAVIDPHVYPDALHRRVAATLTSGTLCFDASDLMPAAMSSAFNNATLAYLTDPGSLDSLLRQLDDVRSGAYASGYLSFHCGQP